MTGPYLAILGATATMVGFIAGLGELFGYAFRLVSGPLSERTGQFWPITLFGYAMQMSAVPLLAWAPNWQTAGALIVAERMGRAIRNPPRDVMSRMQRSGLGSAGALVCMRPLTNSARWAGHWWLRSCSFIVGITEALLASCSYPQC